MFDGIYSVPGFCTFCEAEAVYVAQQLDEDSESVRFCYTCYQAFMLGQRYPDAEVISSEEEEIKVVCPACGFESHQLVVEHLDGNVKACPMCEEPVMRVKHEQAD